MKTRYALLALMLLATPAYAVHYNKKADTGCMPSTDPTVPPCGVKDEAPTYFPDKMAPTDAAKPSDTTPAAPAAPTGKVKKHKKPKPDTSLQEAPAQGTWEKAQ